jgi:antitoxin HicB
MIKSRKKKALRSPARLSTLDELLKEEGKLEEFQATAIKEILARRLEEAMRANNISGNGLADG